MENSTHELQLYQEPVTFSWQTAQLNKNTMYKWGREDHNNGTTTVHIFIGYQQLSETVPSIEPAISGALTKLLDRYETETRPANQVRESVYGTLAKAS